MELPEDRHPFRQSQTCGIQGLAESTQGSDKISSTDQNNHLKDAKLHLSRPCSPVHVAGKLQTREGIHPNPRRPNFIKMARDAEAYTARILPQYIGEAREEIEAIVGVINTRFRGLSLYEQHFPFALVKETISVLRDLEELMPEFQRYGVDDTRPLEQIKEELRTWVQEQACDSSGSVPSPV